MAAVSDKVDFYIEQTVPELQEWLQKDIFRKDEITQITHRRTRFEHLVNSREATPSTYARYASYEMNLESLRQKRVKRLGVKMPMHTGQRRIYYILDRATKRFHGDLGLWMQYIEYARKNKANRKTEELLTKLLRLHPTKPEVWVYAANWAMTEEGDVKAARGYLQRGLRFCERAKGLWIEYAKLEMIYIARIVGRQRILGLDEPIQAPPVHLPVDDGGVALDAGTIALPIVTAGDLNPSVLDPSQARDDSQAAPASNAALSGAIPITIFDAAMKKFGGDESLAMRFFDMFAEFSGVPCVHQILQHILDTMQNTKRQSVAVAIWSFRIPLVGINVADPAFPKVLGHSLRRINAATAQSSSQAALIAMSALKMLVPFLVADELDEDLQRVIDASIRRYVKPMEPAQFAQIVVSLREVKRKHEANTLLKIGLQHFGPVEDLESLRLPSKKQSVARIAED